MTAAVVLSINARTADGLDPSWLWDVPFERLAGRWRWPPVTATGTLPCGCAMPRWNTRWCADPLAALDRAVDLVPPTSADAIAATETLFIGNYTAFADVRRRLR